MIFPRFVAGALLVIAAAASGSAVAESRLFSVQTDQIGVTATAATRDGFSLAVAGRSGGLTFFRIETPGVPVPCLNTLTFDFSDGGSITRSIDFCQENWDLTLVLADPASAESGTIRVVTDAPGVEIVEVFVGGRSVPIVGRTGAGVDIALGSGPQVGQGCQRDFGVLLDDGRRLARMVDICIEQGFVRFPVVSRERPVEVVASQPPVLPPIAEPPPPAVGPPFAGGLPAFGEPVEWLASRIGDTATLRYGVRGSNAGELSARCGVGSGTATLVLSRTTPRITPGMGVDVRFEAGGFGATYPATGTAISPLSGRSHPQLTIATTDPLWTALIRENGVTIAAGFGPRFTLSLKGSAARVREFVALCNPRAPAPPLAAQPLSRRLTFLCNDGSSISASFDNAADTATVYDGIMPPLVLRRAAGGIGARYVASNAELVGLDERVTWRGLGGFIRTCTIN
jgi:hypothetical protein